MNRETIATWNTKNGEVKVTYCDYLYLTVWRNGRMLGCNLSVAKAQEITNRAAGKEIWASN